MYFSGAYRDGSLSGNTSPELISIFFSPLALLSRQICCPQACRNQSKDQKLGTGELPLTLKFNMVKQNLIIPINPPFLHGAFLCHSVGRC